MPRIGNGSRIKSVDNIAKTAGNGVPGTSDTYTIFYNDGTTSTFQINNASPDSALLAEITSTKSKVDNLNLEQVSETPTFKRLSNAMKLQIETIIDRLTTGIPVVGGIVQMTPETNFVAGIASISNPSVNEGSNLIFTVVLNAATTTDTDFTFVKGGNASASLDYTNSPTFSSGVTLLSGTVDNGVIRVPTGVSTFTVTYATINDTLVEIQETLIITIGGVAGTGTILSEDVGVASVVAEGSVPEGQPLFFDVFLTGRTTQATTLPFTIGGTATPGTDYSTTVVFDLLIDPDLAGVTSPTLPTVSGTNVIVPVGISAFRVRFNTIADASNEPEETVILTLAGVAATGVIVADTQLLDVFSARIVEAPYHILTSPQKSGLSLVDGYSLALVERNQSGTTSENYNLRSSTDGTTYTPVGDFNYNATGVLSQPASKVAESFVFNAAFDFAGLTFPKLGFINDEIVEVTAYNSATLTVNVRRGVLDTVPQIHPIGSKIRVAAVSYAIDTTERTDGTLVYYKTVPEFAGTPLDEANSAQRTFTFDQRAARPYPPNRFQINNLFYPESVDGGNINISWQHRNRLDTVILDYNDVNVSGGTTTSNFSIVNLTAGAANTLGATQSTAAVTPATNRHLILVVTSRIDINGAIANTPTVSGLGLTWNLVDTVTWDTSDPTHKRTSIFIAYGTGTPGSVTMNFGGQTQNNVSWVLDQANGLESVGTVVQTAKSTIDNSSALVNNVTFSSTFNSEFNATYVAFAQDNIAQTGYALEANLTSLGNSTLNNIQTVTAYKSGAEETSTITWQVASTSHAAIAIEFKSSVTTVGGTGIVTPIIVSDRSNDTTTYRDITYNVIRDYAPTAVQFNPGALLVSQFEHAILRFDSLNDAFFDGGVVTNASLTFDVFEGDANIVDIEVYRLLQPFVSTELTWNNRTTAENWSSGGASGIGDRSPTPDLIINKNTVTDTIVVSGTQLNNLVQAMIDLPNYGILLRTPSGNISLTSFSGIGTTNFSPRLAFTLSKSSGNVTSVVISSRDADTSIYQDVSYNVIKDYSPDTVEANAQTLFNGFFEQSLIRINSLDDPFFTGGVVTNAQWEFHALGAPDIGDGLDIHRLLVPYNPSQVTWNNASTGVPWTAPQTSSPDRTPALITYVSDGTTPFTISGPALDELIQTLIDEDNYGLLLRYTGNNLLTIGVDSIGEDAFSPKLTFDYTVGVTSTEPGTTYSIRIFDTNSLVRSVDNITGTNYIYTNDAIVADGDYQNVKVQLYAVRDGLNSFGVHEHSFTRPFTGIPIPSVISISGGTEGGNATFNITLSGSYFDQVDYEYTLTGNYQPADIGVITYSSGVTQYIDVDNLTYLSVPPGITTFSIVIPIVNDAISPETGENIILTIGNISNTINLVNV